MKLLIQCGYIGLAGFFGAVARYLVAISSARLFGPGFPLGTLIVNLTGSLMLGWLMGVAGSRVMIPDTLKLAIATGFIGSYTTFSTLAYESSELFRDGSGEKATFNLVASVVFGLIAIRIGLWLAER